MTTSGPSPSTGDPGLETVEFRPFAEPEVLADRYRLGELIGRGGMAEVYRADDLKLARQVAVKLLLDGVGEEADRGRFITEAQTLAALSHVNLVTVLDAGFGTRSQQAAATAPEHDRPFLVMELVDGPTWRQLMVNGPMPVDQLAPIAAQVADALSYVHSRGVVHRDVKPGNVLIGDDGVAKLADFGIARLIEQRTHHTRSGVTLGTAAYIAPEQVSGGTVDGAADVYALGLVLLEAATGERAYGGTPAEAALARLHRAPEIPPLEAGWDDLLRTMTALDPGDRPSAADVATMLQTSAGADPVTQTKTMTGPAPVPPVRPPTTDEKGDAFAQQVRQLGDRLRTLPSEAWGVMAAIGALILLMIALALASGDDAAPAIPDNTPADLRQPLTELHIAVNGEGE